MKKAGILLSILLLLALGSTSRALGEGEQGASFSSVTGKVKLLNPKGKSQKAIKGQAVHPGDTVQVEYNSKATVGLPDGSSLDIGANSRLTITSLSIPSPQRKNFSFKLLLGDLLAQVKKLATSNSSFEVEAGGTVCGVRGTKFHMDFNPQTKQLDLNVLDGVVGAASGGTTQVFSKGQGGRFINGHFSGTLSGTGSSGKGGNNGGKGNSGGSGGNGTGGSSNGSNGNSGNNSGNNGNNSGSNGGSTGDTNGDTNGSTGSNNPSNGSTGTGSSGLAPNVALGDLNNQFIGGVLINSENNLSQAQQSLRIHLVVPAGEAVP